LAVEQKHLDSYGLMDWTSTRRLGSDPAEARARPPTADEDMAFALAMADKQWVTSATLNKK